MTTAIDWALPWYSPWAPHGAPVEAALARGVPLHEALNSQPDAPLRFVAAAELPAATAYERYVFESGSCPVDAGWHDFFNGICWLGLPRAKRRLNQLQAARIAADGIGNRRGPVRDAITLLDENGALLQAPPALWEALLARQWQTLFVTLRPLWAQARLLVVGHALLEKLLAPRKDMTAHVWALDAALGSLDTADAWLHAQLDEARLGGKPFTPLPVLGIPGWCAANADPSFYADAKVFRPARNVR